jgi:hypothetical protein
LKILFTILVAILLAHQASAGCGKWVIRETTDYLDDPSFDEAIASSAGPNATVSADAIRSNASQTKAEPIQDNRTIASAKASPAKDLSGKWAVRLQNEQQERISAIDLILIQSGSRLQGYATLVEDGANLPATVVGSVSEDAVNLQIKLNNEKRDYRMDLDLVKEALQGSYEIYEADKLAEKGNATAGRS